MKVEKYNCDVCGKERGEANHWFVAAELANSDAKKGISVFPWSPKMADEFGVKHLCGQVCAHKLVDEFLSK